MQLDHDVVGHSLKLFTRLCRIESGLWDWQQIVWEQDYKMSGNWLSLLLSQPAPIILLKEGTDTSQGKPQIISNINACEVVVGAVASTLGPRGMDKLIVDGHGRAGFPFLVVFV